MALKLPKIIAKSFKVVGDHLKDRFMPKGLALSDPGSLPLVPFLPNPTVELLATLMRTNPDLVISSDPSGGGSQDRELRKILKGFKGLRRDIKRLLTQTFQISQQLVDLDRKIDGLVELGTEAVGLLRADEVVRNFQSAWALARTSSGIEFEPLLELHEIIAAFAKTHPGLNLRQCWEGSPLGMEFHGPDHRPPDRPIVAPDITRHLQDVFWLLRDSRLAVVQSMNSVRVKNGEPPEPVDPVLDYIPAFDEEAVLVDQCRRVAKSTGTKRLHDIWRSLAESDRRYWHFYNVYMHKERPDCRGTEGSFSEQSDLNGVRTVLKAHHSWWLWKTHAGLIHRVLTEMEHASAGVLSLGAQLDEQPADFLICCDLSTLADLKDADDPPEP